MISGSVIIVAHNSAGPIAQCLCALRGAGGWERIVIDNASRDDTADRAERADPGARVIRSGENLGFAGGANFGARLASGSVLLFLNPDAIATPGALDALAQALDESGAVAAGGLLLGDDGAPDRGFIARRFPTPLVMAAEILLLNRLWRSNPLNRAYRCLDLDYAKTQEVEQPAGACLAVKREAWAGVGGFDERFYPAWFEDVDFCFRLRAKGWKIVYCPAAVFAHRGGHSVNQLPLGERQVFWYGNLLRYFGKHYGVATVAFLRTTIAAGMALRACAALFDSAPDGAGRSEALRAYARVVHECVFSATGSARTPHP